MSTSKDWDNSQNGSDRNWKSDNGWKSWGNNWNKDDKKSDWSDQKWSNENKSSGWYQDPGRNSYSDDKSSQWKGGNSDWSSQKKTWGANDGWSSYKSDWKDNSYSSKGNWGGNYSGGSWGNKRSGPPQLWPVDYSSVDLVKFVKDFYMPSDSVRQRSEEECERIRQSHGISVVSGEDVPKVIVSFEEASFPETFVRSLYRQFGPSARPTPIQMQGWPIAMSGRSVVGIAQTGSGKTLGYIIPAMIHIYAQDPAKPGEGPIALVLVPTRELCTQIAEEASKFSEAVSACEGTPARIACAFGGVKKSEQLWAIRDSLDILVAAPGRLMDFLSSGDTSLARTTYLVLDEADQMFDMGFEPQLRQILTQIRPDRQTLMWSATWPKEVRNLARNICVDNPVHIQIGNTEDICANHQIEQVIMQVYTSNEKVKLLYDEVFPQLYFDANGNRLEENAKMLIFCNTKDTVDDLTARLRNEGVQAVSIHSGKDQRERLWIFDQFRNGDAKVLVATNLMGRGVDVPKVNIVVNYDLPTSISEYIHRIGRTARAGAVGKAISFFGRGDLPMVKNLIAVLNEANQDVPDWLHDLHIDPRYRTF
jgi:ATP-dependent RNA helicase DDX5/DBP2